MNRFTVNGKVYDAPKFDFNLVCFFEEEGIALSDIQKKQLSVVRLYFAAALDGDKESAGQEIEQHLINGGDMTEIIEAMVKEMNESRFFQAMQKRTETTPRTKKAKTEEEK